jgi:hypothetical protein
MLRALSPAAILLAVLALAGPAAAQDPAAGTTPAPVCSGVGENDPGTCTSGDQAIGQGQVVTDPADQVDGPTAPDDGDGPPKQGEQHVLSTSATSPAAAASTTPAPAPPTSAPAVARPAKTLPFTGVNAGPLVLMGVLLLGSGLLLRRRLEQA